MNNKSSDNQNYIGCGCGCINLIIFIFIFWAIFFGVNINGKKWNVDIFPPQIWDMNKISE